MDKPLILVIDEAQKETFLAVNTIMRKYKLPCSFYEPIIAEVHRQIEDGKRTELEDARKTYEEKERSEEE